MFKYKLGEKVRVILNRDNDHDTQLRLGQIGTINSREKERDRELWYNIVFDDGRTWIFYEEEIVSVGKTYTYNGQEYV